MEGGSKRLGLLAPTPVFLNKNILNQGVATITQHLLIVITLEWQVQSAKLFEPPRSILYTV